MQRDFFLRKPEGTIWKTRRRWQLIGVLKWLGGHELYSSGSCLGQMAASYVQGSEVSASIECEELLE